MAGETLRIVDESGDERIATARLTVNLSALQRNYSTLRNLAKSADTGAVVKADGYGLGAATVAPALAKAGCERFFVATTAEGVALRSLVGDAEIFVFSGCDSDSCADIQGEAQLIPALQSPGAIRLWENHWAKFGTQMPCAIMVDTGMNRLGLNASEAMSFARQNERDHIVNPVLVLSHLACADEPANKMNRAQLESFREVAAAFKGIDSSLANSAGILLGEEYHFDLTRPGIAIYGGEAVSGVANPMRPVAKLEAKVIQIRKGRAGATVSYGATTTLKRDTDIAVVGAGYADGYHRAISGSGVPLRGAIPQFGHGYVGGHKVPMLGRVTMDMAMFDITDLAPGTVKSGDWIELFGPNIPIDEVARAGGTIAYELLTSQRHRAFRRYVAADDRG
jgi:alanine racemase